MRIGPRPFGLLRTIISARSQSYTVTRNVTTKNTLGETVDDSSTTHEVNMWLHQPGEANVETERGERLAGDLQGIAEGDPDLEVNDEVTHRGQEYSVDDMIGLPNDQDPEFTKFSLVKVTN